MKIKKAAFVSSCTTLRGKPAFKRPEIAFIGRSNVGKSSLINMLCSDAQKETKGKELARTSASPGKTVAINHFLINDSWYLAILFVLLDSRHELQKIDLDFILQLGEGGIPFAIIFTKADKSKKSVLEKNISTTKKTLLNWWETLPPVFVSSSEDRRGKDEITAYISEVLETVNKQGKEQ